MYTRLKQEMKDAGHPVSEGLELTGEDQVQMRDFFYLTGKTMENYITMSGEQVVERELTEEEKAAQEQARIDAENAARLKAEQEEAEEQRKLDEETEQAAAEKAEQDSIDVEQIEQEQEQQEQAQDEAEQQEQSQTEHEQE